MASVANNRVPDLKEFAATKFAPASIESPPYTPPSHDRHVEFPVSEGGSYSHENSRSSSFTSQGQYSESEPCYIPENASFFKITPDMDSVIRALNSTNLLMDEEQQAGKAIFKDFSVGSSPCFTFADESLVIPRSLNSRDPVIPSAIAPYSLHGPIARKKSMTFADKSSFRRENSRMPEDRDFRRRSDCHPAYFPRDRKLITVGDVMLGLAVWKRAQRQSQNVSVRNARSCSDLIGMTDLDSTNI